MNYPVIKVKHVDHLEETETVGGRETILARAVGKTLGDLRKDHKRNSPYMRGARAHVQEACLPVGRIEIVDEDHFEIALEEALPNGKATLRMRRPDYADFDRIPSPKRISSSPISLGIEQATGIPLDSARFRRFLAHLCVDLSPIGGGAMLGELPLGVYVNIIYFLIRSETPDENEPEVEASETPLED